MASKKSDAATKTLGAQIMSILRKSATTTEDLAKKTGATPKDIFSRCWWLAKKEGLLKSTGHGKTRVWELSARGKKSMSPPAESAA